MKTATLTVSISQNNAMFNASNEVKEHYKLMFKYKSEKSLLNRLNKSTLLIQSQLSNITNVIVFNLSK